MLNNLFLTTACATVFIGTLYPLALEVITGDKISVGAPFFNLTFAPLFIPLMIAVPFGPLLAWKRGDLFGAAQRLMAAGIAALIAIAVLWAWTRGGAALAPLAIGLAVFVIAGALSDLAERTGFFRMPFATAMRRARGLPRSTWGTGLRACRRRRRPDRDRLRNHLEQRIHRVDEAERRGKNRRL